MGSVRHLGKEKFCWWCKKSHKLKWSRFCSDSCHEFAKNREECVCLVCDKPVRERKIFICGKQCRSEKKPNCKTCGKKLRFSHQVYCGKDCLPAVSNRDCLFCQKSFRPNTGTSRFCSNSCCRRYHAPARTVECKCCGLIFKCRGKGQHFCSSVCYCDFRLDTAALEQREKDLAKKIKQFQREIHEESELLDRELRRKRSWVKSSDGTCDWCGTRLTFQQTRFCSDRCNHLLKKHRRRGYEQHGKVNRKAVFDRDSWCCVYCGVAVQEPYDPRVDTSATLDHVIPLAKGGSHSDENCVTACKRCNTKKSDSLEYAVAQEV